MARSGWMTLAAQDRKEVSSTVATDRGGPTTVITKKTSESYAVRKSYVVTFRYWDNRVRMDHLTARGRLCEHISAMHLVINTFIPLTSLQS